MLSTIFEICIIPLLVVLTGYVVSWIKARTNEIKENTNSELANKYITMINDTIINCVIATNQTYVSSLKAQGKFDKEAQEIAFQKTLQAVISTLSVDAIDYLNSICIDLDAYLASRIEAEVNRNK